MNKELLLALQKTWSLETSYTPELWTLDNPALGQCAVSSLVVQDCVGGKIMRCEVERESDSHFYNILDGGEVVDVTLGQFSGDINLVGAHPVSREQVLESENTQKRYLLLSERVQKILGS